MTLQPESYSFTRYLEAKRTVDDRALHRPTLERVRTELHRTAADQTDPIRILDVGVGVGTMLDRLIEWDVLPPGAVEYVGVDRDAACIELARRRARSRRTATNGQATNGKATPESPLSIRESTDGGDVRLTVRYVLGDAIQYAADSPAVDLLVGMAFLDLIDLPDGVTRLTSALESTGLAYFPITFDGETVFRPVADPAFERRLLGAYHATMDRGDRGGASDTGRRLFDIAGACGLDVVSAGGSDWVVHPVSIDGRPDRRATGDNEPPHTASIGYPDDEAYFLHYIVNTVERALEEFRTDAAGEPIDADRLAAWADRRHAQIQSATLTYIAHQYDVLLSPRADFRTRS
ncbi:MAG: class I SAM-dependent methyltransferase [Halobacteriota archaeon]